MFYVRLEENEFSDVLAELEFGSSVPDLNFDLYGHHPQITLVPVEQCAHGDRTLVIDKETGAWCYLNSLEYKIYKAIGGKDLGALLSCLVPQDRKEIEEFVGQLFWLNLLEINGRRFIDPEFFKLEPVCRPLPLFLIRVTNRCNLACKYCYSNSDPSRTETMSWDIAKRAVDLIMDYPANSGSLLFHGGEPLLELDLIRKIIDYTKTRAAETGKEFGFCAQTNGTLLSSQMWDAISDLDLSLSLSLDGDQAANDTIRIFPGGRGSYQAVARSLAMMHRRGNGVCSILVMSKANYNRMPDIVRHLATLPGVRGIKINPLHKDGRAKGEWGELTLTPEEFLEAHLAYLDYCGTTDAPLPDENVCEMLLDLAGSTRTYLCRKAQCGAGRDFLAFDPSGEIYPCDGWLDHRELILGHVQSVEKIETLLENNPIMSKIAQRDCESIPECRVCTYKRFCRGGCSLETYDYCGRADSPHPLCRYFKGMYAELLRRLPDTPQFLGMFEEKKVVYDRQFFFGWND